MSAETLFTFIHTPLYITKAKKLIGDAVQREIERLICENPTRGELQAGMECEGVINKAEQNALRELVKLFEEEGK